MPSNWSLKGVLISPSFLFLIETPPEKTGAYQLGHYEVASHLSYFLWASMPDEELLRLAAAGKLHDDAGPARPGPAHDARPAVPRPGGQLRRQWLGSRPLGATIRPDAKLFPEFNDELAAAMREETVLFFDSIVREDRSVLESSTPTTRSSTNGWRLITRSMASRGRRCAGPAGRPGPRRRAGTGEHFDGHVVSPPHQPRAARPLDPGGVARRRGAAAAAQRAGASTKRTRKASR